MGKPILCLDFDGVCHSYMSGWQGANTISDPPVAGLFQFIFDASIYFDVAVFSSWSNQPGGIDAMRAWFDMWAKKSLPQETALYVMGHLSFPIEKPAAFVGIDDRVITFTGAWPSIKYLRSFKPWNKR